MIKYTIISAVFPPEPVVSAKLSHDIASALSDKNIVTVLSPKPSRPYGFQFIGEPKHFNFNHIQVNSYICASSNLIGRLRESFSFGKHCSNYIANKHHNIDVIYANTFPLLAQFLIINSAKKYNIPIIIHVQDIYPESLTNKMPAFSQILNFLLLPIDKYVLRNAKMIIAISNKMKNYLIRTRDLESKKVAVVQNWQDEEFFIKYKLSKNINKSRQKPFTFMYLGNIGPVAGIDLLIDSFAKTGLKNCILVIAGAGSMKEFYQRKAANENLSTIEFWSVAEGKVPEIQDQADVMLLPVKKGASSSSIPSKLPAYMFSQKPIIACVDEDSDTAAAINEAKCGWIIQPENVEKLTALMIKIISEPIEIMNAYGINGKNYAIDNYSKKNNLPKLISIITETISSEVSIYKS